MAEVADAVEIAKALGPTEETRSQFAKSWLGSSVGQTVTLLGSTLTYLVILALLWKFARGPLGQMRTALGDIGAFALLAFFPAVIIAFNIIPAALKARREARLKRLMMTGSIAYEPGYFRLHPYGANDAARFLRQDKADVALRDWIRGASDPLLYLSGPSGSGKSSLIAASLEPELRKEGWAIVNARLYGDPLRQIARAFGSDDGQPATPDHVYALMAAAAAAHRQTQQSPMLLIIDQFEEYLILGEPAQQAPLQALLKRLAAQPIDGLKLLLSLRSDYQALIFQQDLPPARSTINWFQLAPYRRGDAEAFLQSGGKQMTPDAIASLFKGLDRIEETRGLYRPISLNMIGLVLERMGQTLEGDPETLIQTYLKSALLTGDTKDYVRPLLEMMISDAGTKIPMSSEELAAKTGLERWQVSAAMADLEARGLVRPLHGGAKGWEIAHDFLARLLGQMLGRVKLPLIARVRPYAAPVGLALWMLALGFGVQFGKGEYQTYLRDELTRNGWDITARDGGKFGAFHNGLQFQTSRFGRMKYCHDQLISRDLPILRQITGLTALQIYNCETLRDLKSLTSLKTLRVLTIHSSSINDTSSLRQLTFIKELSLDNSPNVTNIEFLYSLPKMEKLSLNLVNVSDFQPLSSLNFLNELELGGTHIKDLSTLSALKSLSRLELTQTSVTDLAPLRTLISLKRLGIGFTRTSDLSQLRTLKGLTSLGLENTHVTNIADLRALTFLTSLNLGYAVGISNFEALGSLKSLQYLNLAGTRIADLKPLSNLTRLSSLDLTNADDVTDLTPLTALNSLTYLNLSFADGVKDLTPLSAIRSLRYLDVTQALGIKTLAPLKGQKVQIEGASEELLATMR